MIRTISKVVLLSTSIYSVQSSPVPAKLYETPNTQGGDNLASNHGFITINAFPNIDNTDPLVLPWSSASREIVSAGSVSPWNAGNYISSKKYFNSPKQFVEVAYIKDETNDAGVDESQIRCRFFADGVNIGPKIMRGQVALVRSKVDGIACSGFAAATSGDSVDSSYNVDQGNVLPNSNQYSKESTTNSGSFVNSGVYRDGGQNYGRGVSGADTYNSAPLNDYDASKDTGTVDAYNNAPSDDYDYTRGGSPSSIYDSFTPNGNDFSNDAGTSIYENADPGSIYDNGNNDLDTVDDYEDINIDDFSGENPYEGGSYVPAMDAY